MTKITSCNIFAIITAVKYCENLCGVSTTARENFYDGNKASKLSRKLGESWMLRIK